MPLNAQQKMWIFQPRHSMFGQQAGVMFLMREGGERAAGVQKPNVPSESLRGLAQFCEHPLKRFSHVPWGSRPAFGSRTTRAT